jgi:CRP-like cAMP-binding protein
VRFELLAPVPAIQLVRQLKEIPLFRFASMDELFRISTISRQARYSAGAVVQKQGAATEYIQVLLQGGFQVGDGAAEPRSVSPPAMLGFREVLQGTPLQEDACSETESIALVMPAEEFRVLLAANIELAQGLFRMLLEPSNHSSSRVPSETETETETESRAIANGSFPGALRAVDKMMLLQTVPMFSHATAEEMYALAAIARELPLEAETTLFSSGAAASILLLLSGELLITTGGGSPATAGPGRCLGVNETFAGASFGSSARVTRPGKTLQIERDPLFELLSDRMDLLQGIFSAVFHRRDRALRASGRAE